MNFFHGDEKKTARLNQDCPFGFFPTTKIERFRNTLPAP
jgi:hypothetical protein